MTTTTVEQAPASVRDAGRRERFSALGVLWRESRVERVRSCRRWGSNPDGLVGVKVAGDRAGFSGLVTCGSVWACPVCSAKIAAHRATEVEQALAVHAAQGGSVVMATFTIQHRKGHGLEALWDALGAAWGKVTSGRGWVTDRERFGIRGWLRVVEVTHGRHGWHVHIHALLLTVTRLDAAGMSDLHARLYGRWGAALGRAGFAASRVHGVDVRAVEGTGSLGRYFAKAVYEITGANLKGTRHDNVTPFGLLRLVVEDGDAEALDAWHEWERVSRGRRQLTWSKGLREDLALVAELDDQAVADLDDLGGDLVVLLPARSWRGITARGRMAAVLEAAEAGQLAPYLDGRGIEWLPVPAGLSLG